MSRLLVLALALGLAAPLAAQPMSPNAAPVGGTLGSSGETTVSLRAVAPVPTEGCVGYVDPSAPDIVVDWAGGDLAVSVRADFDATLAVHRPDGTWTCDDDSIGMLPAVEIASAAAGRYAVWVGAFSQETSGTEATIVAGTPPPRPTLGPASAALAGRIDAVGGFEANQGAIEVSVLAGGPDAGSRLDVDDDLFCAGYIDAARPSATVAYDADGGTGALVIGGVSYDNDLVLVVRGPGGDVDCNDDFGGTDPVVVVEDAPSGTYTVWLGTFGLSDPVSATLTITETAPEMDFGPDYDPGFGGAPYSEGTYLPLDLSAAPSVRLSADDAGGSEAAVSVRPEGENPVSGPLCMGYIEAAATAAITLAGDGPFAFTASAEDDLTLTVRTPGGDWFCSDDADGLNPGIQIDEVEAGRYLVWVGTFGDLDALVEAVVAVGPGVVESADDGGEMGGRPQSEGTHDGSVLTPGPGRVAIAVGSEALIEAGGPLGNPVLGEACAGFVTAMPTATTTVDGPVTIYASADDTDLTLVVRTPGGAWTCSDDADGPNPAATVDGGAGTVTIWVGTFSRRTEPVTATLAVEGLE